MKSATPPMLFEAALKNITSINITSYKQNSRSYTATFKALLAC